MQMCKSCFMCCYVLLKTYKDEKLDREHGCLQNSSSTAKFGQDHLLTKSSLPLIAC